MAGKMTERATGLTLDEYMAKNLLGLIGAKDIVFWPVRRPDLMERKADLNTWDESGKKAIPLIGFDASMARKIASGGAGASATAKDYISMLQTVLREDGKLLNKESYEELCRPQLSKESKDAPDALFRGSEYINIELSGNVPLDGAKIWALGDLLSLGKYEE